MDDVTDCVFRDIVCSLAKPDVMFTEFTSADGLFSKGKEKVLPKLKFSVSQRPIVAQIWGNKPEIMFTAAKLVGKLGFDGVDINFGCPDRNVMKKPAGAGLVGNFKVVSEIIRAVREGAENMAVSVKTRLGNGKVTTREWAEFLLEQNLQALTVHGRIARRMSKGPADWDEIGKIVRLKDRISPETIVIGNGDVLSYAESVDKFKKYKVDGVMIGRGIFHNPWVFEKTPAVKDRSREQYLEVLLKHLDLFEKTWGENKHFAVLKKFFKMYVKNFKGANALRDQLMKTGSADEIRSILKKIME